MALSTAYTAYRNTSVQTASPDRLLIMLYDGLIRFIEQSKTAIQSGSMQEAHINSKKAQDIVIELRSTLKMEYEISHALASLYDWFLKQLIESNVNKSAEPLDNILPRIRELREAWVQAATIVRAEGATNQTD